MGMGGRFMGGSPGAAVYLRARRGGRAVTLVILGRVRGGVKAGFEEFRVGERPWLRLRRRARLPIPYGRTFGAASADWCPVPVAVGWP